MKTALGKAKVGLFTEAGMGWFIVDGCCWFEGGD
jgi:hypothetical protein